MNVFRMADCHMDQRCYQNTCCRVCAKPLARFKVSYKCASRCDALERTFGVAVKEDNPDTQPLSFCHSCFNVLVRSQKAKEENRMYTPTVQLFAWSAHTEHSCAVYDYFKKASSGGCPRKQKIGRINHQLAHIQPSHTCTP